MKDWCNGRCVLGEVVRWAHISDRYIGNLAEVVGKTVEGGRLVLVTLQELNQPGEGHARTHHQSSGSHLGKVECSGGVARGVARGCGKQLTSFLHSCGMCIKSTITSGAGSSLYTPASSTAAQLTSTQHNHPHYPLSTHLSRCSQLPVSLSAPCTAPAR